MTARTFSCLTHHMRSEQERGLLVCRDNDTEMLINTNQLRQITNNPQLLSADSSFHVRTKREV